MLTLYPRLEEGGSISSVGMKNAAKFDVSKFALTSNSETSNFRRRISLLTSNFETSNFRYYIFQPYSSGSCISLPTKAYYY
jgi:hypothetical protein